MKKIILSILLVVVLTIGYSFKEYDITNNSTATVNQIDGLYIFTDSKPLSKYEVLGEVKLSFASTNNGSYKDAKNRLIEMCRDKYPNAQGLIINSETLRYPSQVIAFKQ